MKVVSVVGARPQFVKLAPIADECRALGIEHIIVHTGQHYDRMLSDVFFQDLGIPDPDVHLGIGSDTHGRQTGAMLSALDEVFATHSPDWVLVYGDTNSTLAAAIGAVKLHLKVAHLEAGLRSFNRRMPEEHNRVLTDHAADLLLAPSSVAMEHLRDEGLVDRSRLVGDVMVDVLLKVQKSSIKRASLAERMGVTPGAFTLATIHRAENTDSPDRLRSIIEALSSLDHPVLLLAHPRLRAKASEFGISLDQGSLRVQDPLAYPELVNSVADAHSVVTDSGGLQKEAFILRTPCTTVRSETEWSETLQLDWNVLVEPFEVKQAVQRPAPRPTEFAPYGSGRAAAKAIEAMVAG